METRNIPSILRLLWHVCVRNAGSLLSARLKRCVGFWMVFRQQNQYRLFRYDCKGPFHQWCAYCCWWENSEFAQCSVGQWTITCLSVFWHSDFHLCHITVMLLHIQITLCWVGWYIDLHTWACINQANKPDWTYVLFSFAACSAWFQFCLLGLKSKLLLSVWSGICFASWSWSTCPWLDMKIGSHILVAIPVETCSSSTGNAWL